MADTAVEITQGTGTNIDTRTEGTNGNHRQVIVVGDPSTNSGVAPVDGTAGLKVNLGADNDVTVTGTVTAELSATDNAVLDTIDAVLDTIKTDTGNVSTKIDTIAGAVSGTEVQVDVLTMPTTTVQATDLDIRDLTATDVVTVTGGAGQTADVKVTLDGETVPVTGTFWQTTQPVSGTVTANLGTLNGASTEAKQDTIISHIDGVEGLVTTTNTHLSEIEGAVETLETTVATIGTTPLVRMAIFDDSNAQITSFGGGTQYEDGDTDSTPTGNLTMYVSDSSVGEVKAVSKDTPLPVQLTAPNGEPIQSTNAEALHVHLKDGNNISVTDDTEHAIKVVNPNGTAIGGGVQYTNGDTDSTPTGNLVMHRGTSNDVVATGEGSPLPVKVLVDTGSEPIFLLGDAEGGWATVFNLDNSNPLATQIVDANGDAITSFGGSGSAAFSDSGNTDRKGLVDGDRHVQVDVLTLPALAAGTNAIGRVGHDITGIGHGVTTVTTAGTDVVLASSTACKKVIIQAQTDNTTGIAVGGSGVDATVATGTGLFLYPGDSIEIQIDNLSDIYIDALTNGEGVRYTYFT
jgi:hypothetical protein